MSTRRSLALLDIPLERDVFFRTLLRHLAGALADIVGVDEAAGFVSVVGQRLADDIDGQYRRALNVERLSREQVADVLVDLKRRIEGDFYVIEENEDRIVLGNRKCPFEQEVLGRPVVCMLTSNMFGAIAAENLGYVKVAIEKAISRGDAECRIVLHLRVTPESQAVDGREYVRA